VALGRTPHGSSRMGPTIHAKSDFITHPLLVLRQGHSCLLESRRSAVRWDAPNRLHQAPTWRPPDFARDIARLRVGSETERTPSFLKLGGPLTSIRAHPCLPLPASPGRSQGDLGLRDAIPSETRADVASKPWASHPLKESSHSSEVDARILALEFCAVVDARESA
jgi:hypothetical protein